MHATPADFSRLTPNAVLDAVEAACGSLLSGLIRPLPSYINRVYEVTCNDGTPLIAKFYRPGRWSRAAIADEHAFVRACAEADIPVIAPIAAPSGETIHETDGMLFALFPKRGGRPAEPANDDLPLWHRLGALVGRVHAVGALAAAPSRITLHPLESTADDMDYLLDGGFLDRHSEAEFSRLAETFMDAAVPLFEDVPMIRIHGDCQRTNVLDRPDSGVFLIDFDDMMNGPAVHDLWMLLPGRPEDVPDECDALLEGYNLFYPFDHETLTLVEPLRAMRMIYYLAWCARQSHDHAFRHNHPEWGTPAFWTRELNDLATQVGAIG